MSWSSSSENTGVLSRITGDGWGEGYSLSRREEPFGIPRGVLIAGLAMVGVAALGWYFVGAM